MHLQRHTSTILIGLVTFFVVILTAVLYSKRFSSLTNAHRLYSTQEFYSAEIEYRKLRHLGIVDDQLYTNLNYIIYRKNQSTTEAERLMAEDLNRNLISKDSYIKQLWNLTKLSKQDVSIRASYLWHSNTDLVEIDDYLPAWLNSTTDASKLAKLVAGQPDKFKQAQSFGIIFCIANGKNDFLELTDPVYELCAKQKSAYTSQDRLKLIDYLLDQNLTGLVGIVASELIQSNPDFYQGYLYRAISLERRGDQLSANTDLKQSYTLAQKVPIVNYYYLLGLASVGDMQAAAEVITVLPEKLFNYAQLDTLYIQLSNAGWYELVRDISRKHSQVDHPISIMVTSTYTRQQAKLNCQQMLIQVNNFELALAYAAVDRTCKAADLGLLYERSFLRP